MQKTLFTLCFTFLLTLAFGQRLKKVEKLQPTSSDVPSYEFKTDFFDVDKYEKIKAIRSATNSSSSFSPIPFEKLGEGHFKVLLKDDEGNISWMNGSVKSERSSSWESKAKKWLSEAGDILELEGNKTSFKLKSQWTDKLNETHLKLMQYHNDVKVYAAEIILHGKNETLYAQNGFYVKSDKINNSKANIVSSEDAIKKVKSELKNFRKDWNVFNGLNFAFEQSQWESELVYYKNVEGQYDLTYHVKVYPNMVEHFEYFVNGHSGEIIESFSTICKFHHGVTNKNGTKTCNHKLHNEINKNVLPPNGPSSTVANDLAGAQKQIQTYAFDNEFFLIDASRNMFNGARSNIPDEPVGAIWTIDLNNTSPTNNNSVYTHVTSSNNSFSNSAEGVSAHSNAGAAYEYYKNSHDRESISGTGQNILSFINVADEFGASMGNAFWNGLGIFYGNGDNAFTSLGKALDVAGHEMSHGVIQTTADLEYRNESGAINESFADIFGAMIDRDDWRMGEDIVRTSAFPSGALRDLSDPHNGRSTGDISRGWQPKHVDERFQGQEDNGGVHINSGITNYAYYLFATNNSVGKDRAEQVYYRALTTYLTRSSGFDELRLAVVKSSQDLFGADVVAAARSAFDQVGIEGESEGDFQNDIEVNPGQVFLLESDQNLSNLFIKDSAGNTIFNPLTGTDLFSKPSVSDDGSLIAFVSAAHQIHIIVLDWHTGSPSSQEFFFMPNEEWDNVAISKDGRFIAAIDRLAIPRVFIFDLLRDEQQIFNLSNPTFTDGIQTGDMQYADVMEFDASGTTLMFDGYNEIGSNNSGSIGFFDIGFLNFWDRSSDTWASGDIDKLFGSLPSGVEVFNPSYSKNSSYIVAFDVVEGFDNSIYGVNLETRDLNKVFTNTGLGYPNYSPDDKILIYDLEFLGNSDIGGLLLEDDKITSIPNSDGFVSQNRRWGTWFGNGERILSDVEDVFVADAFLDIYPNPADNILGIDLNIKNLSGNVNVEVSNINGQLIISKRINAVDLKNYSLDISRLESGSYIVSIRLDDGIMTKKFIKK